MIVQLAIDIGNGFRAWGVSAMLFAFPAIRAFVTLAWREAVAASHSQERLTLRADAFARAFLRAGHYTNLPLNAWWSIAMLAFAGIAGGAIFVSSNFFGGFDTDGLNFVMLFMWALLSTAAWGVAIETAARKINYAVSAGLMLVTVQAIALTLGAEG